MDTCYVICKTLFKDAHLYSDDLAELGRHYCEYRKLIPHWSSTLPEAYYEIAYENPIKNQRGESKKLFEHCDLKWNKIHLDFHKNTDSGTSTDRAAQTRQSIHNSSIEKWKQFQEQLSPLYKIIDSKSEQHRSR